MGPPELRVAYGDPNTGERFVSKRGLEERKPLVVDGNGAKGLLQNLPLNSQMTFLWWFHVPEARQRAMLVGKAVIVGAPDEEGNTTDVPETVTSLLMETKVYTVEVQVIGETEWHPNAAKYSDFWEAVIWAMLLLERWAVATDVRVVPVIDQNILPIFREDNL